VGLDFVGSDAHWSYSGFMRFRIKLAKEIGLDLETMHGFGGIQEWPDAENEPLVYLLDHSDCDGELFPEQCAIVAPRLLEIVSKWDIKERDAQQAILLAEGMKKCAEKGEVLVFC